MSDDGGAPNRATVALVYSAVGEVKALTEAGFTGIQRQLDQLVPLPERVADLSARTSALERAHISLTAERLPERTGSLERTVKGIEERENADGTYRRVHLPTLTLSVLGFIVALAGFILKLA